MKMFERLGRKFIKGAKAELSEPGEGAAKDIQKVIKAASGLLEIGIMVLAVILAGKSAGSSNAQAYGDAGHVVINNYIYTDRKDEE